MLPFDRGDSFIRTENAIWAIVLVRTLQYSNITIRIEKQQQDDEKDHEDNSKYRGRRQASHGGMGMLLILMIMLGLLVLSVHVVTFPQLLMTLRLPNFIECGC